MQIAQPPLPLFDFRLEQVDRIAVLCMALDAFLQLGLEERAPIPIGGTARDRLLKLPEQLLIAG